MALPDGTIALLSANEKDGDLEWGIANDYNQLLLPYPAIGCASIEWGATQHEEHMPHAVCCLRGGSTYLIPYISDSSSSNISNTNASTQTPITVFTFDTETHARFVSDFTAGNLIYSPSTGRADASNHSYDNTLPTTMPVLMYGWAGGIVDVYSCDLMETSKHSCRPVVRPKEISTLEELISNGSLSLLIQVLSVLEDSDPLIHQTLWKEARRECREASMEDVLAKDLLLPKFAAIRSLLLLLSTTDSGPDGIQ